MAKDEVIYRHKTVGLGDELELWAGSGSVMFTVTELIREGDEVKPVRARVVLDMDEVRTIVGTLDAQLYIDMKDRYWDMRVEMSRLRRQLAELSGD